MESETERGARMITLGERIAKTAYNYAKRRVSTTKLRKMADVEGDGEVGGEPKQRKKRLESLYYQFLIALSCDQMSKLHY